ncbi:hypothetical protein SAMD00023353_3000980 [Rosellinia necatrix]|uniref:Uncharacterized protein n=1 Tax=Rosellinia necatrix TaxID=77044 RepID=A0A1S8A8M1_ROSNE|nr:hypothetical protein SAMD00023353_3000980 [Rosellinia necatrix]
MVCTRTQDAAKRPHHLEDDRLEDQDQHLPTHEHKRQRRKSYHTSSEMALIQGQRQSQLVDDARHSGPIPLRRPSVVDDPPGDAIVDDVDPNNPVDFWRKKGHWPREVFEPTARERILARQRSLTIPGRKRSKSD